MKKAPYQELGVPMFLWRNKKNILISSLIWGYEREIRLCRCTNKLKSLLGKHLAMWLLVLTQYPAYIEIYRLTLLFFSCALISGRNIYDTVGINVKSYFNLRDTSWGWRNTDLKKVVHLYQTEILLYKILPQRL